jgi:hypothetical protein
VAPSATPVLVTIDTELSVGSHIRGLPLAENLRRSAFGGDVGYGIDWQARRMADAGVRAVFFVDPMPVLVFGPDAVRPMVEAALVHGHEVQLHIHTEWLRWVEASPVGGRRGANIGDFSLDDQVTLLGLARDLLIRCGAPAPTAFRAGNFGANDDTLVALARLGIGIDSSFNGAAGPPMRIGLPAESVSPTLRHGVVELPVSLLREWPSGLRPLQLCAVSAAEMRAALDHAQATAAPLVNIVSHSFELLTRDRDRANLRTVQRFEAMLELLSERRDRLPTVGCADVAVAGAADPVPASAPRTLWRMAEQAHATLAYERSR